MSHLGGDLGAEEAVLQVILIRGSGVALGDVVADGNEGTAGGGGLATATAQEGADLTRLTDRHVGEAEEDVCGGRQRV